MADYNSMSDKEFKTKYRVNKDTYRKRVNRHEDPYKYRVNSASYKALKKANDTELMKWSASYGRKRLDKSLARARKRRKKKES